MFIKYTKWRHLLKWLLNSFQMSTHWIWYCHVKSLITAKLNSSNHNSKILWSKTFLSYRISSSYPKSCDQDSTNLECIALGICVESIMIFQVLLFSKMYLNEESLNFKFVVASRERVLKSHFICFKDSSFWKNKKSGKIKVKNSSN